VTGRDQEQITLVDEDTSGRGRATGCCGTRRSTTTTGRDRGSGRRKSSHTESKRLFVDLVTAGAQTLAFTRARQTAEQYATDSASDLRERGASATSRGGRCVSGGPERRSAPRDRGGPPRRRSQRVWSTSALELGVDVGGLDAVILDGYPGTRMSAYQRGAGGPRRRPGARGDGRRRGPARPVPDAQSERLLRGAAGGRDLRPRERPAAPRSRRLRADERAGSRSPDDERFFGESFPRRRRGPDRRGEFGQTGRSPTASGGHTPVRRARSSR